MPSTDAGLSKHEGAPTWSSGIFTTPSQRDAYVANKSGAVIDVIGACAS